MRLFTLIPEDLLEKKVFGVSFKVIIPIIMLVMFVAVLLSPLFNLHAIHHMPSAKLFAQHMYFDSIAGLGGFYAAGMCKHWYHKIPVMIAIDLLSTLALTTLVG